MKAAHKAPYGVRQGIFVSRGDLLQSKSA